MIAEGLRFYPDSVDVVSGAGGPIFVHGSLEKERSDFEVVFSPLFSLWKEFLLLDSFSRELLADGSFADPTEDLETMYGAHAARSFELDSGLVLLSGSSLPYWAPHCDQHGLLLFVVEKEAAIQDLAPLYWGGGRKLANGAWPPEVRSLVQNWDGVFWQFFSRSRNDLSVLAEAHRDDRRIRMFRVSLHSEFPNPSEAPQRPA